MGLVFAMYLLLLSVFLPAFIGCGNELSLGISFRPEPTTPPDSSVQMNFYFGNLHSHTAYSDGAGSPQEAVRWARDSAGYDFYAITDHAELLTPAEWDSTGQVIDAHTVDGEFVAIRGFEWTHNTFGHINVLGTSCYVGSDDIDDLGTFYDWIDRTDGLAQFNHPGREPSVYCDLAFQADVHDNFYGIETGNKNLANISGIYLPFFTSALKKGWRVAPTNNQDNHTLSTNSHRSVIIAAALTRDDLLDALRERRLYSSDDPNLELTFKSGDYWMGSNIVGDGGLYTFYVSVADDEPIDKIQFLNKAGTVLDTHIPPTARTAASAYFKTKVVSDDCFYVKVYGNDTNNDEPGYEQQIVVSAPIWVFPQ
ncbi:MAG: CehA/McbA family metallohydrolase [Chitinispirillaceae bacterium]